jgi:APA family basic amino acid/polyamine antiporter
VSAVAGTSLDRRLGVGDAVVIGLGSMVGAGVFAVWAPAAAAAGGALLLGLLVAAFVAYCNATASAQLAAAYPTSGGTYAYGRERLGEWWGFVAGWGFVVGKTASCAAMALTFATYAVPGPWWVQRLAAVGAVVALTAANHRGITRTATLTRILVTVTLVALAVVVTGILTGLATGAGPAADATDPAGGAYGVLQSAGLLFFAFAGYARIATLGEEVRDPARTIPRAVPIALGAALAVYAVVGVTALAAAGPERLAAAADPLAAAARAAGAGYLVPVVAVGAAVASLGALLALVAGIARTTLAMARNRDLPPWLAAVHPRFRVPHRAGLALAVLVSGIVLAADVREVIGFSSAGVLLYYAIANAAALTQPPADRRWPRWLHALGLLGCVVLVVTLPLGSLLAGAAVILAGVAARLVVLRRRRGQPGAGAEPGVTRPVS